MYSKAFKLKRKSEENGNMGEPALIDGEICPVLAAQLAAADAENHAPAIVAQLAMAVQAVSVANYQVPPPEKFSFKQKIGHVGFGASNTFEKRLVWIKKAAKTKEKFIAVQRSS